METPELPEQPMELPKVQQQQETPEEEQDSDSVLSKLIAAELEQPTPGKDVGLNIGDISGQAQPMELPEVPGQPMGPPGVPEQSTEVPEQLMEPPKRPDQPPERSDQPILEPPPLSQVEKLIYS